MSEVEKILGFSLNVKSNVRIIDDYIEKIANKQLNLYQSIIQYGSKEGESLAIHILNCVFLASKLSETLKLSLEEEKLLYIALTLHDINKTDDSKQLSYKHIATIENIEKEIIKLGIPDFMIDWEDYLEDIKILLHVHSGHNNLQGDLLYLAEDNTKLGKEKLEALKYLVRACDVADLSTSFEEKKKKDEFLFNVNNYAKNKNLQYKLIYHKILEQRGILTNLQHKNVMEILQKKYNAIPIFLYPEGNYYLLDIRTKIDLSNNLKLEISTKIKNNLDILKKSKFGDYIGKDQKQGIKVDPEILGLATIEDIFSIVDYKIQKKKYNIYQMEEKDRNKLIDKLKTSNNDDKNKIELLLSEEKFYPENQDLMKLGELIRTFYIFLKAHCDKKLIKIDKYYKDPWIYIYEVLEFPKEKIDFYSPSDGLYQRSYMIVKHINKTYDEILELIKNKLNEFFENNTNDIKKEEDSEIINYSIDNIIFSFEDLKEIDFTKKLFNYVKNNHKQCSCCNSCFEAKEMMSGDVPEGIKVQQFSNRLTGGIPKDPKRNICPICKEQFALEKLNFSYASKEKPLFLHLMPHSFLSQEFLVSFKNTFEEFIDKEISSFYINIKETLKTLSKDGFLSIKVEQGSAFGIGVPKYPNEVIGNSIILPLNSLKLNNTERYLRAIDYALFLNKYFNFKVVITESSIPIFNKNEFDEIFFDGIPSALKGFVTNQNLNRKELFDLWERYVATRNIAEKLYSDDSYLKIVKSLIKGEQNIFFTIDRLIEEKLRNSKGDKSSGLAQYLSKEIYDSVEKIINS
ncbi:MAG: type I-D CRISPR-associated protein Cas10d/Csc3 [Candidatus Sericytochromatia bacterium]